MLDFLVIVGVIGVCILVKYVVLPRLGVAT